MRLRDRTTLSSGLNDPSARNQKKAKRRLLYTALGLIITFAGLTLFNRYQQVRLDAEGITLQAKVMDLSLDGYNHGSQTTNDMLVYTIYYAFSHEGEIYNRTESIDAKDLPKYFSIPPRQGERIPVRFLPSGFKPSRILQLSER